MKRKFNGERFGSAADPDTGDCPFLSPSPRNTSSCRSINSLMDWSWSAMTRSTAVSPARVPSFRGDSGKGCASSAAGARRAINPATLVSEVALWKNISNGIWTAKRFSKSCRVSASISESRPSAKRSASTSRAPASMPLTCWMIPFRLPRIEAAFVRSPSVEGLFIFRATGRLARGEGSGWSGMAAGRGEAIQ